MKRRGKESKEEEEIKLKRREERDEGGSGSQMRSDARQEDEGKPRYKREGDEESPSLLRPKRSVRRRSLDIITPDVSCYIDQKKWAAYEEKQLRRAIKLSLKQSGGVDAAGSTYASEKADKAERGRRRGRTAPSSLSSRRDRSGSSEASLSGSSSCRTRSGTISVDTRNKGTAVTTSETGPTDRSRSTGPTMTTSPSSSSLSDSKSALTSATVMSSTSVRPVLRFVADVSPEKEEVSASEGESLAPENVSKGPEACVVESASSSHVAAVSRSHSRPDNDEEESRDSRTREIEVISLGSSTSIGSTSTVKASPPIGFTADNGSNPAPSISSISISDSDSLNESFPPLASKKDVSAADSCCSGETVDYSDFSARTAARCLEDATAEAALVIESSKGIIEASPIVSSAMTLSPSVENATIVVSSDETATDSETGNKTSVAAKTKHFSLETKTTSTPFIEMTVNDSDSYQTATDTTPFESASSSPSASISHGDAETSKDFLRSSSVAFAAADSSAESAPETPEGSILSLFALPSPSLDFNSPPPPPSNANRLVFDLVDIIRNSPSPPPDVAASTRSSAPENVAKGAEACVVQSASSSHGAAVSRSPKTSSDPPSRSSNDDDPSPVAYRTRRSSAPKLKGSSARDSSRGRGRGGGSSRGRGGDARLTRSVDSESSSSSAKENSASRSRRCETPDSDDFSFVAPTSPLSTAETARCALRAQRKFASNAAPPRHRLFGFNNSNNNDDGKNSRAEFAFSYPRRDGDSDSEEGNFPRTIDFLSFLCLRGTPALPPISNSLFDTRGSELSLPSGQQNPPQPQQRRARKPRASIDDAENPGHLRGSKHSNHLRNRSDPPRSSRRGRPPVRGGRYSGSPFSSAREASTHTSSSNGSSARSSPSLASSLKISQVPPSLKTRHLRKFSLEDDEAAAPDDPATAAAPDAKHTYSLSSVFSAETASATSIGEEPQTDYDEIHDTVRNNNNDDDKRRASILGSLSASNLGPLRRLSRPGSVSESRAERQVESFSLLSSSSSPREGNRDGEGIGDAEEIGEKLSRRRSNNNNVDGECEDDNDDAFDPPESVPLINSIATPDGFVGAAEDDSGAASSDSRAAFPPTFASFPADALEGVLAALVDTPEKSPEERPRPPPERPKKTPPERLSFMDLKKRVTETMTGGRGSTCSERTGVLSPGLVIEDVVSLAARRGSIETSLRSDGLTRATPNHSSPTRTSPFYSSPKRATPFYSSPTRTSSIHSSPTRASPRKRRLTPTGAEFERERREKERKLLRRRRRYERRRDSTGDDARRRREGSPGSYGAGYCRKGSRSQPILGRGVGGGGSRVSRWMRMERALRIAGEEEAGNHVAEEVRSGRNRVHIEEFRLLPVTGATGATCDRLSLARRSASLSSVSVLSVLSASKDDEDPSSAPPFPKIWRRERKGAASVGVAAARSGAAAPASPSSSTIVLERAPSNRGILSSSSESLPHREIQGNSQLKFKSAESDSGFKRGSAKSESLAKNEANDCQLTKNIRVLLSPLTPSILTRHGVRLSSSNDEFAFSS